MASLTFIDWFAGIGGFRRGMEEAGHKCIGYCEFDKYANASYRSMHTITEEQREYLATLKLKDRQKEILKEEYLNNEWYANDIRGVKAGDIPKADIWCFGAPCFVAGTLITTHRGRIPIEDIQVGDLVLTHKNRWKPVLEKMINYHDDIYNLKVQGSPNIEVTGNHRFYIRYKKRIWDNDKRKYDYYFTTPEWKSVNEFNGKEYVLMPHNPNETNSMNLTDEECYLMGRYIADGYLQEYKRKDRQTLTRRVVLCIGKNKEEYFESKTKSYEFYIDDSGQNCKKYISTNKRLFGLCKECGSLAENKRIPNFILDLPTNKLEIFMDGYLSGDGNLYNEVFQATTVSKELVFQLGECVYKTYRVPFSISYFNRPSTCEIDGRIVNQKGTWTIRFHKEIKKQNKGLVIDDDLWMPLKNVGLIKRRKDIVYNLEVKDDHSYTAGGLAAHNCQSFSIAGRREGLEGESGLIHEIFRLLRETREEDRPQWLIYENVKGMFSSNRGFDFLAILLEMDKYGYDTEWKLN